MKNNEDIWVTVGYDAFARQGRNGLKVEQLAQKAGVSKSSFYHRYSDVDLFVEVLLEKHLSQAQIIAHKERQANCISPDLVEILVEHRMDLLFNRQLRIDRANERFSSVLKKTNEIIGNDFVLLWLTDTRLNMSTKQAQALFSLALENFYLQVNEENLNREWLVNYFDHLKALMSAIVNG